MINLNNGVANVKQTPAIIADILSNIPSANSVGEGTLFIDITTRQILRSESGGWITYGFGAVPDLQSVLNVGNLATNIEIESLDSVANETFIIRGTYLEWLELTGNQGQYLYPSPAFALQKVYLPSYDGNLAVTQHQIQADIISTPYTLNGDNQNSYRVRAGASSIVLNPANWVDRITVTLCFDVTAVTFSVTGGATLRGIALINVTGLYYVTYLSSANTFYLSHTA